MKRVIIIIIFGFQIFTCLAQTSVLNISAYDMEYSSSRNFIYVISNSQDIEYPNHLIEMDPKTGQIYRLLSLESEPGLIKLTTSEEFVYVSFRNSPFIKRVSLESFQIDKSINIGEVAGISSDKVGIYDFEVIPDNDNQIAVVRSDKNYSSVAIDVAMFSNGIILANKIECRDALRKISDICITEDGAKMFCHGGLVSSFTGYFVNIEDTGLVLYENWELLLATYGEVKIYDGVLYSNYGQIVAAFSDSIPIMKAKLATKDEYDMMIHQGNGFSYSPYHNAYIYAENLSSDSYLNFFHGTRYNYLGSIHLELNTIEDHFLELVIVDENRFVILSRTDIIFQDISSLKKSNLKTASYASDSDLLLSYNLAFLDIQEMIYKRIYEIKEKNRIKQSKFFLQDE